MREDYDVIPVAPPANQHHPPPGAAPLLPPPPQWTPAARPGARQSGFPPVPAGPAGAPSRPVATAAAPAWATAPTREFPVLTATDLHPPDPAANGRHRTRPDGSDPTTGPAPAHATGTVVGPEMTDRSIETPENVQPLADEAYLAVHDYRTRRPRLRPEATDLLLAAALLAELVLAGKVSVGYDTVEVTDTGSSQDPLIHHLTGDLLALPDTDRAPAGCLRWLAARPEGPAASLVTDRLLAAGVLVPAVPGRWGLHRGLPHVPTQARYADWPTVRVGHAVTGRQPLAVHDRCLAGLLHAADLDETLLPAGTRADRTALDHEITQLPPALAAILGELRAAIGNTVRTRLH